MPRGDLRQADLARREHQAPAGDDTMFDVDHDRDGEAKLLQAVAQFADLRGGMLAGLPA